MEAWCSPTYSFNNGNCLSTVISAKGELAIGGTRNNSLEQGLIEIVDIALLYSILIADTLELIEPPENGSRVLCVLSVDHLD